MWESSDCAPERVDPRRLDPGKDDVSTWISREHLGVFVVTSMEKY